MSHPILSTNNPRLQGLLGLASLELKWVSQMETDTKNPKKSSSTTSLLFSIPFGADPCLTTFSCKLYLWTWQGFKDKPGNDFWEEGLLWNWVILRHSRKLPTKTGDWMYHWHPSLEKLLILPWWDPIPSPHATFGWCGPGSQGENLPLH